MPEYDFATLSPIDFEQIARDLLQSHLKIYLESFKQGRDGGIDFRYSGNKSGDLIVQVKHFVRTGFDGLLAHIKNEELSKIKTLSPSRYLLVTSVPLSPANKKIIKNTLSPYIKRSSDIYGKDDLNNLLGLYPQIEKQHFKLWLSSTSVLEEILHSQVINQTKIAVANIEKKALIYVMNESFQISRSLLKKYNYVVIAGIPGIGKSTLAEMLVLQYIRDGYEFIDISSDINEAYSIRDQKHPRVILYDDFLGRTSLQEKLNKNEDNRLFDFISTIRSSKHAKLILTTREYILKQAQKTYEVLNSPLLDVPQCVVNLSLYTRKIRAEILYNHFYYSHLEKEYISEIIRQKTYIKIIDHPNYNPRIIEYMTDPMWTEGYTPKEYPAVFLNNLRSPFLIWEQAYKKQLSEFSQHLLLVLGTLPHEVFLEDLKSALAAFRVSRKESFSEKEFMESVREIEGSFIAVKKSRENLIVEFHNASIQDYIEKHLDAHYGFYLDLTNSAVFFEQVVRIAKKTIALPVFSKQEELNAALAMALTRTLRVNSCALSNYLVDNEQYKEHSFLEIGDRVRIIASFANLNVNSFFEKTLLKELDFLTDEIRKHVIQNDVLLSLIEEISKVKVIEKSFLNSLLILAKDSFLDKQSWISDVSATLKFLNLFPNASNSEDLEIIHSKIIDLIEDVLELDDIQAVSDELYELKRIESEYSFGLEEQINKVELILSELENEIPHFDNTDHNEYPKIDVGITNDYLIELFATLVEMQ